MMQLLSLATGRHLGDMDIHYRAGSIVAGYDVTTICLMRTCRIVRAQVLAQFPSEIFDQPLPNRDALSQHDLDGMLREIESIIQTAAARHGDSFSVNLSLDQTDVASETAEIISERFGPERTVVLLALKTDDKAKEA